MSWKKILVSGSQIHVQAVTSSNLEGSNNRFTYATPEGIIEDTSILSLDTGSNTIIITSVQATGSFTGSFTGDASGLTNVPSGAGVLTFDADSGGPSTVDINLQTFNIVGTSNEIETNASSQTLTIGLPNDVTITNDLSVGNNLTVTGDLTVSGTTTIIDTTNLLIEDKFALFASGSDTNTDGGIVVQQGPTTGYALGVDANTDRWALQNNLSPSATSITPDAYVVTVTTDTEGNIPTNPNYGGASTGYGNLFIASDTENIFLWV